MRILVIDDDTDIRKFLKECLSAEGFAVDTAGDGAEGSYKARTQEYDAIILDYVMPKKNGGQVLKELRAIGKMTPVIMLSVEDEPADKVSALNLGADDYIAKPFSFTEMRARLRAVLRRPQQIVSPLIKVEDFVLDTINQKARRGQNDIYLTRKEYALTEYLMRNCGTVVSRGMLMEHVWTEDLDPFSNTIEAHMRNLRKKVDSGYKKKLLQTIPGRGYKIDAHRVIFT